MSTLARLLPSMVHLQRQNIQVELGNQGATKRQGEDEVRDEKPVHLFIVREPLTSHVDHSSGQGEQ
jgi:hypothetical protein